MTLAELLDKHPEYGNVPIVLDVDDGSFQYVGERGIGDGLGSASVFLSEDSEDNNNTVLVFTPN